MIFDTHIHLNDEKYTNLAIHVQEIDSRSKSNEHRIDDLEHEVMNKIFVQEKKMSFDAHEEKIRKIFAGDAKFEIPRNQRKYV